MQDKDFDALCEVYIKAVEELERQQQVVNLLTTRLYEENNVGFWESSRIKATEKFKVKFGNSRSFNVQKTLQNFGEHPTLSKYIDAAYEPEKTVTKEVQVSARINGNIMKELWSHGPEVVEKLVDSLDPPRKLKAPQIERKEK